MTAALRMPRAIRLVIDGRAPDAGEDPAGFAAWLAEAAAGRRIDEVEIAGLTGARTVCRTLGLLRPWLAEGARLWCAEADFASVYDGLVDLVAVHPEFRFDTLTITGRDDDRPGRAIAGLDFERTRRAIQDPASLPQNKHKALSGDAFASARPVMPRGTAETLVARALTRWQAPSAAAAARQRAALEREFPDAAPPARYWHDRAGTSFRSFFTWGHDHDFGFGHRRAGAMSTRHAEITAEAVHLDLLPFDLDGLEVLNIGCWTGGDFLVLTGLGGRVLALEEHPVSARAAARLAALTDCPAEVVRASLFDDRPEWRGRFDVIYCSGVIYHVTDPLLFLRICFAYLAPGGRLVLETKADAREGSGCAYAGVREKGWNWYAPTREALGRWLVDAGFPAAGVRLHWRSIGRLMAAATKAGPARLPESAGFSRPGSWLEGEV